MIAVVYTLCLIALFAMPILAKWRSGLPLALLVTIVQLGLVATVMYWLTSAGYFRGEPHAGQMTPTEAMYPHAEGYIYLFVGLFLPGFAALAGGAIALVWTVVVSLWQAVALDKDANGLRG